MTPPPASAGPGGTLVKRGRTPEQPFRLTLPVVATSFADQLFAVKAAASITCNFDFSEANFLSQTVVPFTKDIISLYPFPAITRWFDTPRELYLIRYYDGVGGENNSDDKQKEKIGQNRISSAPMMANQVTLWDLRIAYSLFRNLGVMV